MSEARDAEAKEESGYTVVGVVEDGVALNRTVSELRELGITGEELTIIVKRKDSDVPEPFPEGTRYLVVPDDLRGLEIPIGFAAIFVVASLLFAFTAPAIGTMVFVFFIVIATILVAGVFTRVGVDPILMQMDPPSEDSNEWNEEFEKGKALVFASTADRRGLKPVWEVLERGGADFYIVELRLKPEPIGGATLHRAGEENREDRESVAAQGKPGDRT